MTKPAVDRFTDNYFGVCKTIKVELFCSHNLLTKFCYSAQRHLGMQRWEIITVQPRHACCTAFCKHVIGIPSYYYAQLIAIVISLEDLINCLAHHCLSLCRSVPKLGAVSQVWKKKQIKQLWRLLWEETANTDSSHPSRYKAPHRIQMKTFGPHPTLLSDHGN